MIKIFKNNDYKVVTRGVFESIFKPLGYKQVETPKKVVSVQPKVVEPKEVEEPKVVEPKVAKPKAKEPKEPELKKESSSTKRKRGE